MGISETCISICIWLQHAQESMIIACKKSYRSRSLHALKLDHEEI